MSDDPILRQVEEARQAVEALGHAARKQIAKERRELVTQLAQGFRRIRTFEGEREWIAALLDACTPFCIRCALLTVNAGKLEWKAARGFEIGKHALVFPASDAAAFSSVIESREVTVAISTVRELSSAMTHVLGEDPSRKVTLIPIATQERVAAVLYAEDAESAGLELVAVMAGAALEAARGSSKRPAPLGILQIAPAVSPAVLPEDEALHLRAQRFARLRAAEIRLHEADAIKSGRSGANLYAGTIRTRIDDAREAFRNQFFAGPSTLKDYLHEEFVRMLANGKVELMGPEYPGPLE
jgi:hypothetical protein